MHLPSFLFQLVKHSLPDIQTKKIHNRIHIITADNHTDIAYEEILEDERNRGIDETEREMTVKQTFQLPMTAVVKGELYVVQRIEE